MEDNTQTIELVKRAKGGDADAFGELYGMLSQKLYRTAFFILRDADDAEDVVMDAVADAFVGLSRLRDDAVFEGWLFRILCNKARRYAGRRKQRESLPLNEELAADSDGIGDAEGRVALRSALERLNGEERAILAMCVCADYTSGEAAAILGLNANTVRSKQLRALEKLKKLIGGSGDDA